MCTRGVWQLRTLLFQFSEHGGSSRGVREYMEKLLVPFAEANPQIQIAVSMKTNHHPFVRGWYVKDSPKRLSLTNLSAAQVAERVQFLRDVRPVGLSKSAKPFRDTPSIQGTWELGQLLDQPHRSIRA